MRKQGCFGRLVNSNVCSMRSEGKMKSSAKEANGSLAAEAEAAKEAKALMITMEELKKSA